VTDLFLIHDSFATTPADTTALFNAVREAFVEQYHNKDIYQTLKDQVVSQLDNPEKADLPEVPKQGTLDLKQVLESYYCFI
jgi:DNA-directed RNA polymerase